MKKRFRLRIHDYYGEKHWYFIPLNQDGSVDYYQFWFHTPMIL